MPKKIPYVTKRLMEELYAQGLPIAEIATRADVSYPTAHGYTILRQRVDPETEQPFKSRSQLMGYLARQRVNPETEQPFESLSQLNDYLARRRVNPKTGEPFSSRTEYEDYLARQRVNPETEQPFESLNQYQEYTARQRVNRPENQGLSDLIKRRLKELKKNQSWLSREIGVSREVVSKYVQGKHIPNNGVLERLFSALEVPYKTLDDLLEGIGIK